MFLTAQYSPKEVLAQRNPKTIVVAKDGSGNFTTIQEAIISAENGDVISVREGIYVEHVVVNKSVSLVGEDKDLTIIDGNNTGDVVYLTADAVHISGFTLRYSGLLEHGIHLDRSNGNNINQNIIMSTNGIGLYYSSNNIISNNIIIFSFYTAIYAFSSSTNAISNNNISLNKAGIRLQSSSNNVLFDNTLSANYDGGIIIDDSSNNTIYQNNFVNGHNALILQSDLVNTWDHSGEGNYWSDYAGHDLDKDGIGDIYYYPRKENDTQNQDRYPLMGFLSLFIVTSQSLKYEVALISNSTVSSFRLELGAETANKMIRFEVSGSTDTAGFSRLMIPIGLMPSPYIVLIDSEEIIPTVLNTSSSNSVTLYFTYEHRNQTITVIYSEALHLYYELLDNFTELQSSFLILNDSYVALLRNFESALGNLSQTEEDFKTLNTTYGLLLENYSLLTENFGDLQRSFSTLNNSYEMLNGINTTYHELLHANSLLLGNYSQLQQSYFELNQTLTDHLNDFSKQAQNMRNLLYIYAITIAFFLITTVYLSKQVHSQRSRRNKTGIKP